MQAKEHIFEWDDNELNFYHINIRVFQKISPIY